MYGLVLALVGVFLGSVVIYSIGLGLFIDEFGLLIGGGKTHKDNYSKLSLIILGAFVILVFIFRNQLLFWM